MKLNLAQVQKMGTDMLRDLTIMCADKDIPYFAIYGTLLGTIRHSGPIPWDYDIDIYVPENRLNDFLNEVKVTFPDKYWVDYREGPSIPRAFPRIGYKGYETEILHLDVFRMSGLANTKFKQQIETHYGRMLFVIWKAKTLDLKFYYPDFKRRLVSNIIKALTLPFSVNYILKKVDKLCGKYEVMSTRYVGRMMGEGAIYPTECFSEIEMLPYDDFYIRVPKEYHRLLTQMYENYMEFPPEEDRNKFYNMVYEVREL